MVRIFMAVLVALLALSSFAHAADLEQHDRSFNWQDREYFGHAYIYRTLAGGDSAAAGESGDAGAGASGGSTGGDSGGNGDGCGR